MNEEKKIRVDDLLKNLQARMNYKNGVMTCQVLFNCWLCARKLPRLCETLGTKPPARITMRCRVFSDGYAWLKPSEVQSFERYAGYVMRENV